MSQHKEDTHKKNKEAVENPSLPFIQQNEYKYMLSTSTHYPQHQNLNALAATSISNRSSSAPPSEICFPMSYHDIDDESLEQFSIEDPRLDPNYAAFFYANSKLDPRLPPPLYLPGQSWQLWNSPANKIASESMDSAIKRSFTNTWSTSSDQSNANSFSSNLFAPSSFGSSAVSSRKNLVEMIQEDFPKTPSPVYALQHLRQQRSSKGSDNTVSMDQMISSFESSTINQTIKENGGTDSSKAANPELGYRRYKTPEPEPALLPTNLETESRSNVLEEFRTNKSKKFETKDLVGHFVEFSGDQHGSRFIQHKLEAGPLEEKNLIFTEILPSSLLLMTDVFGNYVIQKFFEFGSNSQKTELVKMMSGKVLTLSLQMYGCRVVQKALEHVPSVEQAKIVCELDGHVLKLVKDQNGNHVIQKCIECVPANLISFISAAFSNHVNTLAGHPYGCRVLQRLFEYWTEDSVAPLLEELHKFISTLVQDQYGNYVIQHILERGTPKDKSRVINKFKGSFIALSKHKFASNVIEKAVVYGSEVDRQLLIDEVLTPLSDASLPLIGMCKDQYANYVVQKMLELSSPSQKSLLMSKLTPNLALIRKFTYGKHILNKIETDQQNEQLL